jgi:Spy/CpxP family protein refolding chaperone
MKRLFLSLAILACLSLTMTVGAQNTKRGSQHRLSKELNLTTDQQEKIKSADSEFKTKISELKSESDLTKEDKQAKMKELTDQHRTAVNDVLTPEQQAKMKELKKDKKKPRSMHDRKSRDVMKTQRSDRMKDLNLTDDQKQKIKTLNEEFRAKNKEIALQYREALNKVYTPEQQAKLKEMKESRKEGGRDMRGKLGEDAVAKLKTLKENFEKEKKAVELSRIAPEAQKQKISELRDRFRKEKRQIIMEARKTRTLGNNPV